MRRRQQFVFAAAVLLSSTLAVRTITSEPSLLQLLWRFVERRASLDNVQLLYWCRVIGNFLLKQPEENRINMALCSLGLGHMLRSLLLHLRCDAVCTLFQHLLGIGEGEAYEEPARPTAEGKGVIALHLAICGEDSMLTELVGLLFSPDAGANAAVLLTAVCQVHCPVRHNRCARAAYHCSRI